MTSFATRTLCVTAALACAPCEPLAAQADARPEIAAIVVTMSACPCHGDADFWPTIARIKTSLANRARSANMNFAAIGVALDQSAKQGAEFLLAGKSPDGLSFRVGEWDEVHAGRSWMNELSIKYIWRDSSGTAAFPQLIIVTRDVGRRTNGLTVGPDTVLVRLVGWAAIKDWAGKGMQIQGFGVHRQPRETRP